MALLLLLVLALTTSAQNTGQDYYYNSGGGAAQFLPVGQSQRAQQYSNFFGGAAVAPSSVPTSYQSSGSGAAAQPPAGTFQPSSYQLPPARFDPYQPFHTNQHLPQPFHTPAPTPYQDYQQQFGGSSLFDIRPQGLVDQLDTANRWRQPDRRAPHAEAFLDLGPSTIEPDTSKPRRKQPIRGVNSLTTAKPRVTTEDLYEVTESVRNRNRYKTIRNDVFVRPTTYTPSSTPAALLRQRSRFTRPNRTETKNLTEPVTYRGDLTRVTTRRGPRLTTTTTRPTTPTTTSEAPEYEFYDYELAPQNEADGPISVDQLADIGPPEAILRPNFDFRQNFDNNTFYDVFKPFKKYESEPDPVVDPYKLVPEPTITTFRNKAITISTPSSRPPEAESPIPEESTTKPTEKGMVSPPPNEQLPADPDAPQPTESWVIVASVQTSRSVSGARFLPSDLIKQEEQPKPRTPTGGIERTPKTSDAAVSTLRPSGVSQDSYYEDLVTEAPEPNENAKDEPVENKSTVSTESIIDKLDRVQSELSSGILGFRHGDNQLELEPLPDMTSDKIDVSSSSAEPSTVSTTEKTTTTTPTTTTPTTTTTEATTESSFVRKFVPSNRRTTTAKTTVKPTVKKASLLDNIEFDDLSPGLLPPGFKVRTFKPKSASSTTTTKTTTTTTTTTTTSAPEKEMQNDEARSRENSGRSTGGTSKNKINFEDVSAFLPPGYKAEPSTTTTARSKPKSVESLLSKITFEDISALLPPGYKEPKETSKKDEAPKKGFKPVEVPSNLLPPGYRPDAASNGSAVESVLNKVNFKEAEAALLPTEPPTEAPTTTAKVVFPTRPNAPKKPSPPRAGGSSKSAGGLSPVLPKINKGWPTRATTEFTGWPTPSTTPISVEKILAAAKAAAATSTTTTTTTTSTTTTTTTTTTTPRPTTPGICSEDCDMAATIRLVGPSAKWLPELLDHNTIEYQQMANDVSNQLEMIYRSSDSLSRWYKKINIDAFSEGSIIVDYFVELSELGRTVNTADMKRLFHQSLERHTASQEALADNLRPVNTSVEYKLGRFTVDPKYTDFLVLPKRIVPTVGFAEESEFLPQWAIAVIVIGLASLLFVIIFGVTVLVNRHKGAKKKQPAGLTEDMLHELNKNHLGGLDNFGADDLYNMEDVWNEKPIKKRSSGSIQDNSMANLYDSWRSEWNGYYYNAYYGGNGSSTSGYSRRRSDYDTNF